MGLDNGIVIAFHIDKMKGYQQLPGEIFRLAESIHCDQSQYDSKQHKTIPMNPIIRCEVVYWRKWWGVRNEVMRSFGLGGDPYRINLIEDNIKDIIEILKSFRNKDRWNYEGMSVWDYEDDNIEEQIDVDIYVLESLIEVMRQEKELINSGIMEIYFYDSY